MFANAGVVNVIAGILISESIRTKQSITSMQKLYLFETGDMDLPLESIYRGVQPACGKLHSWKFPFAKVAIRIHALRSNAEDAPDAAVELKCGLSSVQVITRDPACAAGA